MMCLTGFPVTLKCLILNDREMSFYAKICFHRRYDGATENAGVENAGVAAMVD